MHIAHLVLILCVYCSFVYGVCMLVGHLPCRQPRCTSPPYALPPPAHALPRPAYAHAHAAYTHSGLHFLVTVVQKLYICSLWGLIFDDSCTKTLHLSSHCTLLVCACLGLSPLCVSCDFSHFDAPLTHILIV